MGVKIEAQDVEGKKFKMTLEGFEARVFQHEYDHTWTVFCFTIECRARWLGTFEAIWIN